MFFKPWCIEINFIIVKDEYAINYCVKHIGIVRCKTYMTKQQWYMYQPLCHFILND